jgi:hypothetical protein
MPRLRRRTVPPPSLKLGGHYYNRKGKPKPNSWFNFARVAELAWSRHYLPRALAELEQTGFATFPARANQFVRIGKGVIEFHLKGEPAAMQRTEIRDVRLAGGVLTFHHHDARWYRSAGTYKLSYGQLANARVFLLLLDKLMGYRFT